MDHYINKFITNLPDSVIKSFKGSHIDLILEGGSFNGSYQAGCLLYLKELETKGYLVIDRISGASIGSLMAFLYLTNNLDLTDDLYKLFYNNLKENFNLSVIKELKKILIEKERMTDKLLDLVNKKLYISYYNLDKSKKIIKKTYKNIDDIFTNNYLYSSICASNECIYQGIMVTPPYNDFLLLLIDHCIKN